MPEDQGGKQEPILEEEAGRPSSKKSSKKGGKKGKKDGKKEVGPPKPPLYKVVDLEDRLRRLYRCLPLPLPLSLSLLLPLPLPTFKSV